MGLSKESFLPDEADCAETWRRLRWPDGLECPDCGSTDVQTRQKNHRNCFHRYCCRSCGRWFTDTTSTFSEASNMSLSRWAYLIREMDKKRSINDISKDLDLTYKTVLGMSHKVKEAIYDRREKWLDALTGEVEADDVHVKGGQQGQEVSEKENGRTARMRGLSARGRGSYETDRPLVVSWVERGETGPRVFELRRTAGKKSLLSRPFPTWKKALQSTPTPGAATGFWMRSTLIAKSNTANATSAKKERTATLPRANGRSSSPGFGRSGGWQSATCICTCQSTVSGAVTGT